MGTQSRIEQAQQAVATPHWSLGRRLAFRFFFIYLALFSFTTQIVAGLVRVPKSLKFHIRILGEAWPLRRITLWTAAHIFRIGYQLVYMDRGSGDKTFDWVETFCLLVSPAGMAIWSVVDRRRKTTLVCGVRFGCSFALPRLRRCFHLNPSERQSLFLSFF